MSTNKEIAIEHNVRILLNAGAITNIRLCYDNATGRAYYKYFWNINYFN